MKSKYEQLTVTLMLGGVTVLALTLILFMIPKIQTYLK